MHNLDSTLSGSQFPDTEPGIDSAVTIVWTILAHPDCARVGERAPVPELASDDGSESQISRSAPIFSGVVDDRYRPLEDRHLSRSPLLLRRGSAQLEINRGNHSGDVEIDGQSMGTNAAISFDSLDEGVVVTLAGRIALLLHRAPVVLKQTDPRVRMLGSSPALYRTLREISAAATNPLPTLIVGETGTGKELAARSVHDESSRAHEAFIAVNVASIPPDLAAAELFGSEQGAFTGARARTGLFQQAHRGTLFLDEIGAIDGSVQTLLLRVLEDGEVRPLGSEKSLSVDVHIVAATDEPLEQCIAEGGFRRPLYERLRGSVIHLPPLRKRREDIGRLLYHFLQQELERADSSDHLVLADPEESPWLPARTVCEIARQPLPGNVRQLKLLASRMVASFSHKKQISHSTVTSWLTTESPPQPQKAPQDNSQPPERTPPRPPTYRSPDEVSPDELVQALRNNEWKVLDAAKELGVSRTSLYALIEEHPALRKGSQLGEKEIRDALAESDGRLALAAALLEVSKRALQLRVKELGIRSDPAA